MNAINLAVLLKRHTYAKMRRRYVFIILLVVTIHGVINGACSMDEKETYEDRFVPVIHDAFQDNVKDITEYGNISVKPIAGEILEFGRDGIFSSNKTFELFHKCVDDKLEIGIAFNPLRLQARKICYLYYEVGILLPYFARNIYDWKRFTIPDNLIVEGIKIHKDATYIEVQGSRGSFWSEWTEFLYLPSSRRCTPRFKDQPN
eukprot:247866_1